MTCRAVRSLPAGATAATVQLFPYTDLKLQTPLPEKPVLLIFLGGSRRRQERDLHGLRRSDPARRPGTACRAPPSARRSTSSPARASRSNTSAKPGNRNYELRVVSITPASATTASVRNALAGEDKAGRKLLREAGLAALP